MREEYWRLSPASRFSAVSAVLAIWASAVCSSSPIKHLLQKGLQVHVWELDEYRVTGRHQSTRPKVTRVRPLFCDRSRLSAPIHRVPDNLKVTDLAPRSRSSASASVISAASSPTSVHLSTQGFPEVVRS